MKSTSTMSVWVDTGEKGISPCMFDIETLSIPSVGDIINLHYEMDKEWYDANFGGKSPNLFDPKIFRGRFEVTSVSRYIETFSVKEEVENFIFPSLKIVETFEVIVKLKT